MTPSQAPYAFLGTWKVTKCQTSRPDLPHPVSGITIFTQEQDGIHYSGDTVWSDGRTSKAAFVYQLDGSWYPVTGSLVADSASLRLLEDGSLEARMKKGGADLGNQHCTFSADGRVMTSHWEFIGPDGAKITWELMSERQ